MQLIGDGIFRKSDSEQYKNNPVADTNLKEAETCMKDAMGEASNWLKTLGGESFKLLANQKYPSPFDSIMNKELKKEEINKKTDWLEQQFGKIEKRDFFGAHVVLNGKIFSFVPGEMDRFKQISPKRLGLGKIDDLFVENIEGNYVLLMYESEPSLKEKAEELVVLWPDGDNKWHVVDYYAADEI